MEWKSESIIAQLCLTLCDPMDYSPPGSSVHGISRQEFWRELPFPSPGDFPDPGIEPRSPALAGWLFNVGDTRETYLFYT